MTPVEQIPEHIAEIAPPSPIQPAQAPLSIVQVDSEKYHQKKKSKKHSHKTARRHVSYEQSLEAEKAKQEADAAMAEAEKLKQQAQVAQAEAEKAAASVDVSSEKSQAELQQKQLEEQQKKQQEILR